MLGVLGALGCGGGSSGGGGGSLNFRPVWEQRALGSGTGASASAPPASLPRASFGPNLPAAVKTIRIAFDSDAGQRCCLAVDPTLLPIDPVSGRRFLVLSQLPGGGATVSLAGFAADFAPTADAVEACPTDPPGAGQACDPSRVAAPSFQSDAHRVNVVSGIQTEAGDIPVFAIPFILDLSPDVGATATNPVAVTFTVVDAATGIDQQSVSVAVTQNDQSAPAAPLTLTPCDDTTGSPCSAAGALRVSGFRVARQRQTLQSGDATAQIQARNLAAPPRALDLSYSFSVQGGGVATPTPVGTPGRVVIVRPGGSIASAARAAPPGSTIVVAPGLYAPVDLTSGNLQGPITLLADVSGIQTDSAAAPVTISVRGGTAGIHLAGQSNVTVDGFSVRGATSAGVLVEQSDGVIVQNCTVTGTRGDGILFDSSSSALAFNNVVLGNSASGIQVRGSSDVRLINNTLYQNQDAGIVVGDATDPSTAIMVRNNIVNLNTPTGLTADPATDGYDADYNLNTDGYGAETPAGSHDIIGNIANPLFIAPTREDFHLAKGLSGSQSPAVNAGDPDIEAEILGALGRRTTQTDGSIDAAPVDLGYHYPAVPPTPTPKPKPTRTSTSTPTKTATARS
jgi:parallel beta-helix repeat protein